MSFAETTVRDYTYYTAVCSMQSGSPSFVALRKFLLHGTLSYLTINPENFETAIQPAETCNCTALSLVDIKEKYRNTPYIRALKDSELNSQKLQNAGFSHFNPRESGVNVTADLCPSTRPLDRVIFTSLIDEFSSIETPVPIALAITGKWMENHAGDILWLKKMEREKRIDITWINHSYNHYYNKNIPLKNNFLLKPKTSLEFEILGNEKKMIENGLLPSIYFRFPGLVSNYDLFHKITAYGLIPIGSDSWLAKNQRPHKGSIILVHANGNEPLGIKKFIQLLRNNRDEILHRHWFLYDLRESMADFEDHRKR